MTPGALGSHATQSLRVFISYSREDAAFATELEGGLRLLGYDVFIDRHLSGGEAWRQSLANHIAQADTIVFVMSPSSVESEMCQWEVDEATRLSKRILPVVARDVGERPVPERLRELNYIFFSPPNSFVAKLGELRDALDKNLDWIREHTRYLDMATRWAVAAELDKPGRLLIGTADIEAARKWLVEWQRPNPEPTPVQRAFIAASVEHADAEAAARQRSLEERERLAREREDAAARAFAEAERAEAAAQAAAEERKGREAALAEAERSAAETARSQKRAGRLLWGVLALGLALLGGAFWQARDNEKREVLIYTSLAASAMAEDRHDRAMRFALQALPAEGCLFCAPSSELEGRLAGAATLTRQARVGRVDIRQGERLVALSPDGRTAVAAHSSGAVRLVDRGSGREVARLDGHTGFVSVAAFSADSALVATGSFDRTWRVWNVRSGAGVSTMRVEGSLSFVASLAFSRDARRLAAGFTDGKALVLDLDSGRVVFPPLDHAGGSSSSRLHSVGAVGFSPDGETVATGADDGKLRFWKAASGELIALKDAHTNQFRSLTFSRDGKRLATTAADRTIRIWDVPGLEMKFVLQGHLGTVWSAQFNADASRLVSASFDRTIRIWNTGNGREMLAFKGHLGDVRQAVFDTAGSSVVSISHDDTIREWVSRDNLATSVLGGSAYPLNAASFISSGSSIATAGLDGTARIWRVGTDTPKTTLRPTLLAAAAAFSPRGDRFVTVGLEGATAVWDTATGTRVAELGVTQGQAHHARFNADGTLIAIGGGNTVKVWDAADGRMVQTFDANATGVAGIEFSRDGRLLASLTSDGWLAVRSTTDWKLLHQQQMPGLPRSMALDGQGRDLVLGNLDGSIRRLVATTGQETGVLRGHTERVGALAFSPDERRIVSGSDEGVVRMWDTASGREIARIGGDVGLITSVSISPDGERLLIGGSNGLARIWDASWFKVYGAELRRRVCAEKLVGAQAFTDEELTDPILRGIDPGDPVARNPCLKRGPLSFAYWTRLPGQWWRGARRVMQ